MSGRQPEFLPPIILPFYVRLFRFVVFLLKGIPMARVGAFVIDCICEICQDHRFFLHIMNYSYLETDFKFSRNSKLLSSSCVFGPNTLVCSCMFWGEISWKNKFSRLILQTAVRKIGFFVLVSVRNSFENKKGSEHTLCSRF